MNPNTQPSKGSIARGIMAAEASTPLRPVPVKYYVEEVERELLPERLAAEKMRGALAEIRIYAEQQLAYPTIKDTDEAVLTKISQQARAALAEYEQAKKGKENA